MDGTILDMMVQVLCLVGAMIRYVNLFGWVNQLSLPAPSTSIWAHLSSSHTNTRTLVLHPGPDVEVLPAAPVRRGCRGGRVEAPAAGAEALEHVSCKNQHL